MAGVPSVPVVAPQFPQAQPAAPPPAEQASLDTLEAQVQLNPTVATLAFGLGQRYYELGRYDDAIAVLDRAAVANPSDVALQQLLGDVLHGVGRDDEAAAAYRAAAEAAPSAGNYNKLGLHLLGMGELDQATEAFLQAINDRSKRARPILLPGADLRAAGPASASDRAISAIPGDRPARRPASPWRERGDHAAAVERKTAKRRKT